MKINKNEDLLKLKIDIQEVDDAIAFQEIALFLDKPELLRLLPNLRETYKIEEFIDLNKFTDYYFDTFVNKYENEKGKIYLSKYKKMEEFKKRFPDHYEFIIKESENGWMSIRLDVECNIIAFEFNRPYYFADIFKQALFCNIVNDYYHIPTFPYIFDLYSEVPQPSSFPRAAILVSPITTYDNLKSSFQMIKKLMKTHPQLSYYKPRTDFVNNIRKYRHWYWKRIDGNTYEKIAKDWVESQLPKEDDTTYIEVLKGVKIYEKLLKQ